MRLIQRHQVSDETFRIVTRNHFPTFRWRGGAGEAECVRRTLVTDSAFFIEETIRGHVRIEVDAARRIKMHVMPGRGVHRRLANRLLWPWRSSGLRPG